MEEIQPEHELLAAGEGRDLVHRMTGLVPC